MLRLHGLTASKLCKIGRLFRTAQPFKFDVALATLRSGGSGGSELLAGYGGRLFRTYLTKMNHLNAKKRHSFLSCGHAKKLCQEAVRTAVKTAVKVAVRKLSRRL